MIEKTFTEIYTKLKLNFYRNLLSSLELKEHNLTVTETFTLEAIKALGRPNINQLANFLNVSQPNMTYKLNTLAKNGYVEKIVSKYDKREVFIEVTDKFESYENTKQEYVNLLLSHTRDRFSQEDIDKLTEMLNVISTDIVIEVADEISHLDNKGISHLDNK